VAGMGVGCLMCNTKKRFQNNVGTTKSRNKRLEH